jgi:XTP/dITP diphosphohydrolase
LNKALLLATTNTGKVREMQAFLQELPLHILSLADLPPIEICEETGVTFLENARSKSIYYSRRWEGLTLGEDSGLEVAWLKGAPGVHSARYSAPQPTSQKNIRKVMDLLQGVKTENRQARFVSTMVVSLQGKVLQEIEEDVSGIIAAKPKGSSGFGYDPIFFYPPLNKTFAELSPREKNRVSHRGRALQKLRLFLQEYLQTSS